MTRLLVSITLLLCGFSTYAQNLCDVSCDITFNFTSGGSIEAVEALTITFGTNGSLDLGATGTINVAVPPASTDYSAGGSLDLAAGESISFDAGGSIYLGEGGNLDYTNIAITTGDDIAISGSDNLTVSTMTLSGAQNLSITTSGSINVVGEISSDQDMSVTIVAGGTITDGGVTTNCDTGATTDVTLSTEVAVSSCLSIIDVPTGEVLDLSGIGVGLVNPLSVSDLSVLDGLQLITSDGETCTVTGEQCVTETGAVYVFNDNGELVRIDGDGAPGLLMLFFSSMLVLLLRWTQARRFSMR